MERDRIQGHCNMMTRDLPDWSEAAWMSEPSEWDRFPAAFLELRLGWLRCPPKRQVHRDQLSLRRILIFQDLLPLTSGQLYQGSFLLRRDIICSRTNVILSRSLHRWAC